MKKFTRDTIQSGMRIKLRNGNVYIVIKNESQFIGINGKNRIYMMSVNKDTLKSDNGKDFDITEIYNYPSRNADYLKPTALGELLWKELSEEQKPTYEELLEENEKLKSRVDDQFNYIRGLRDELTKAHRRNELNDLK